MPTKQRHLERPGFPSDQEHPCSGLFATLLSELVVGPAHRGELGHARQGVATFQLVDGVLQVGWGCSPAVRSLASRGSPAPPSSSVCWIPAACYPPAAAHPASAPVERGGFGGRRGALRFGGSRRPGGSRDGIAWCLAISPSSHSLAGLVTLLLNLGRFARPSCGLAREMFNLRCGEGRTASRHEAV